MSRRDAWIQADPVRWADRFGSARSDWRMPARSGPRMGLMVNRDQPVDGDVRIDLRRRERGMPEDLLDTAQVSAALEEMGGGGMPQPVRAGVRHRTGRRDPGVHDPSNRARVDPAPTRAREDGRGRAASKHGSAARQPFEDGPERRNAHRYGSLLAPLAEDPDRMPAGIEIGQVQTAQFPDPDPGCGQEFHDRRITQTDGRL